MTVTVTALVCDITGRPDNTQWHFTTPVVVRGGAGGIIVTKRRRSAQPLDGVVTVELEPGIAVVEFDGEEWTVEVPGSDADLWNLIAASVAFPPDTAADAVGAAVAAWLEDNPPEVGGGTDVTVSRNATTVTVVSSTGADGVIPAADGSGAGAMTTAMQAKLAGIIDNATANATNAQLRDRATHTGTQTASTISDFNTAADARVSAAAGSSVASLVGGKVPTSQIPSLALTSVQTAANQSAMLALTTQEGDLVIRTDEHKSYMRNAGVAGTMADFTLLDSPSDAVTSVNGQTGLVVLGKGDVGLSNANNTADSAKPISTAQQTALDLKAPLANPTFTGTVAGVTKTHVGLANVDNTADSAKPVSTAQAAADTAVANASIAKAFVDAKGDLIVASANDTPARLAVGSNGQVLTADSAEATGVKWATPSGGGSSGILTPGVYASRPAAGTANRQYACTDIDSVYYDNGTSWDLLHIAGGVGGVEPPSSGWSWVNQGTATVAADKGGRLLTMPSAAANMRMEVRTLASAINYTATCYVESAIYSGDSSYAGMILRNSGSGNFVLFMCGYEASPGGTTLASVKWSSPAAGIADYRKQGPGMLANGAPRWLRVRDNGTTRFLEYSYNGVDWIEHFSVGRTDYLTPDQVGWGGYSQNGKINTARLRSWSVV